MTPQADLGHKGTGASTPAITAEEAFATLRRDLRHHDARWYYGCRLRSFGATLLDSMKYLNVGVTGAYAYAEMHHRHCVEQQRSSS